MTHNPYNFTEILFNETTANSVYWSNSELVISMLIFITLSQLIQTVFLMKLYFKSR